MEREGNKGKRAFFYLDGYTPMVHNKVMLFIETPIFTRELRKFLQDEEYRALQLALLLRPTQGNIIPGRGGLRKI